MCSVQDDLFKLISNFKPCSNEAVQNCPEHLPPQQHMYCHLQKYIHLVIFKYYYGIIVMGYLHLNQIEFV